MSISDKENRIMNAKKLTKLQERKCKEFLAGRGMDDAKFIKIDIVHSMYYHLIYVNFSSKKLCVSTPTAVLLFEQPNDLRKKPLNFRIRSEIKDMYKLIYEEATVRGYRVVRDSIKTKMGNEYGKRFKHFVYVAHNGKETVLITLKEIGIGAVIVDCYIQEQHITENSVFYNPFTNTFSDAYLSGSYRMKCDFVRIKTVTVAGYQSRKTDKIVRFSNGVRITHIPRYDTTRYHDAIYEEIVLIPGRGVK